MTIVFTAPTSAAIGEISSRCDTIGTLNGAVTLAPRSPIASAKRRKSAASAASSGTYAAFRPTAANPALCIAGDSECSTGRPTTPYSAASERMRRKPNSCSSRAAGS